MRSHRITAAITLALLAACDVSGPSQETGRVDLAGRPFGLAVSAAGVAYVTKFAANAVARMDLPGPEITATVGVGAGPSSVTFNAAGNRAYVGNQRDGTVSVVDVGSNSVVGTLAFQGSVTGVAVAPGDTLLLVGTDAAKVYFVRLPSLALVDSVALPEIALSVYTNAMVSRDTLVYASCPFGGVMAIINLRTRQVVRTLNTGGTPQGMVLAAGGTQLYLANEIGEVQVWDLATGTLKRAIALPPGDSTTGVGGGGFGLAQNPVSGLLFVSTSYYGRRVVVVDPAAGKVVRTIETGGVPRRLGFPSSSAVGVVANEFGWVDIIR